MPWTSATNVGVGLSAQEGAAATTGIGSLSPRRAIQTVKEILQSPQFQDGVRLFAIGAAVSASKVVFDAVISAAKRLLFGEATFRDRDDAYRWMLLVMMMQPSFRKTPRAVEVSTRPSLLANFEAAYSGNVNKEELGATWAEIQPQDERSGDCEKNGALVTHTDARTTRRHDDRLGVHMYPASGENVHFVFEGTHFWASRKRKLVGDTSWEEIIKLSYLSTSSRPLRRIIRHAKSTFQHLSRGRISIFRLSRYGEWTSSSGIAKRSLDSIHLPTSVKDTMLDDARRFSLSETRRWYSDRGIPYRRGYLLHGKPGSGKSSMCHALASELDRPVYVLSLSSKSLNDATLVDRMSEVPYDSIVLLEDIDAAFVDGDASAEDASAGGQKKKPAKGGGRGRDGKGALSFSALLNAIDGIGAAEGRLLCMTTNHADRLDSALVRPGRIDSQFAFENATPQQARELYLHWYAPRGAPPALTDAAKTDSSGHTNGLSQADAEACAQRFGVQVPSGLVSVAALQGFLLSCGADHQQAVEGIAAWIAEQKAKE